MPALSWATLAAALLLHPATADEYCCEPHDHNSSDGLWEAVHGAQPWLLLHHYWHGADLEEKDHEGMTPMAWAARSGQYGIVRMFMDLNATIDPVNDQGITPLMDVVQRGMLDMAQMLLYEGANVNTQDPLHLTPVWYAAKYGWVEMVHALLDYNAETEARDNRNIGPLALAALINRLDVASLLLERGANPKALKEVIADPSLRRPVFWWDESTLESLLEVRGYHKMLALISEHLERRLEAEAVAEALAAEEAARAAAEEVMP